MTPLRYAFAGTFLLDVHQGVDGVQKRKAISTQVRMHVSIYNIIVCRDVHDILYAIFKAHI